MYKNVIIKLKSDATVMTSVQFFFEGFCTTESFFVCIDLFYEIAIFVKKVFC